MKTIKPIYKMRDVWVMRVKSSNIKAAAYDLKNKFLYIQFKMNGFENHVYRYKEIPVEWWIGFTMAESKGKYFQKKKYALENFDKLEIKLEYKNKGKKKR